MKVCRVCGETKELSEFHRRARNPDGRVGICKSCKSIYDVELRKRRIPVLPSAKTCSRCGVYREAGAFNKNKANADGLNSWCKSCHSEYYKDYVSTPEGRQRKNVASHTYAVSTKGRSSQRTGYMTYRARKRGLPATLTLDEWEDILFLFDHRCAYCMGVDLKLEQDHFIPVSKGGGYTLDNIVPACRPCNATKGNGMTS